MSFLFGILIFLSGAAVGSFVLVIADRWNTGFSFLKGRSFCFSCSAELEGRDLVPVFSFLFLRGRCRRCGSRIPFEAFAIELLMGVLSLLAGFKSDFLSLELGAYSLEGVLGYILLFCIFSTIVLISIYDLRHFIIPDQFLIFLLIFSSAYLTLSSKLEALSFLSGLLVSLPFLLIYLISHGRWIGLGDIKYMAVLGFWLGLPIGLSAIVMAFWVGAAFALAILLLKKLWPQNGLPLFRNNFTIKSEIPFGPFISLGAILNFFINVDLFQIKTFFTFFS
jgi:leader peptidase (prepilin peptidase)/N-methyltransferase